MSKKRACKDCKTLINEGDVCPNCKSTQFTTTWIGRVTIVNPEKSEIAKRTGIEKAGEYAIKVR